VATLIRWELRRMLARTRTHVGLGAAAALPILVTWALAHAAGRRHPVGFVGAVLNGFHVPLLALLTGGRLLLPLLTAVVGGDLVAGEAAEGTLRLLLLRPVRRGRLLAAKAVAALVYALLLPCAVAAAGLAAGGLAFGLGPMPTLSATLLPPARALLAVLAVVAFSWACLSCVAAWSLLFSVVSGGGVAAVAWTVAVLVVAEVVSHLPAFSFAAPYVFATYFDYAANLLRTPVDWPPVRQALAVLGLYAGALYVAAHAVFTRRDVLH
jgi:ABC-2 type transport system permease protein